MINFNCPISDFIENLHLKPIRIIDQNDENWIAAGYLVTSLSSFSDGLVVMNGDTPVGMFGGKLFLKKLIQNPTYSFFQDNKVKDLMDPKVSSFTPHTNLSEIIEYWMRDKFAFSIIDTGDSKLALSIRSLLELIGDTNSSQQISELPKKKIITYNGTDSIGSVINKMFENQARRLQLEGTDFMISDRTILEDICTDMNYLKYTENFLELDSKTLHTFNPEKIPEHTTISELAKHLSKQIHSFVICNDQIITPWDLLMGIYKNMANNK